MTEQAKKVFELLPQSVAGYVPVSPGAGEACSSCWFYMQEGACQIVKSEPLTITANGYCEFHKPASEVLEQMPEITIIADSENVEIEVQTMGKKESAFKALLNRVAKMFTPAPTEPEMGFKALGNGWWLAAYTNNFEDVQAEILSLKAHDLYISRLKEGFTPYPDLCLWHEFESTVIGKAVDIDRYGHVVVAIGKFSEDEKGKTAEQYYLKNRKVRHELSHGFTYPKWALKNGVYHDYNTFEISVLPAGMAANPYTSFEAIEQERKMALSEQKKNYFTSVLGEALGGQTIAQIEALEDKGKAIAEAGAKFKERFADYADVTPAETTKDNGANAEVLKDFVGNLLNGQAELLNQVEIQGKALEAALLKVDTLTAELKVKSDAFEAARKEVATQLSLAPRSVTQAQGGTVEDADALKALTQAQTGDDNVDKLLSALTGQTIYTTPNGGNNGR